MAAGENYHFYSGSDSDDDDVDRYVFLARQPGQHVEEYTSDDVDEETDDEGRGGDGPRGKRPLIRDASDDASPSPNKKARLGLIIAFPAAEQTPTSSTDQATSSPCGGMRTGSYPGARRAAARRRTNTPPALIRGKEKPKNKTKRPLVGVSGKRSRSSPGCEEEVGQELRRDVMTAAEKTSPSSSVTSVRRFQCNLCERCFEGHQALGGHVRGHQKKARIAAIAAAASLDDADGRGNRTAEIAVVEQDPVGYAEQKTSVAAIGANGNCHKKKVFDEIDDASCHEDDVDTGGHRKAKNKKKLSTVAEEHMGAHGDDGSINMRVSVFARSHVGVNGHDRNDRDKASSRSFHNGNEETAVGTGSHNDADVRNKNADAGASRNGGVANGNSNVHACSSLRKCKVCGMECLTGRALGGHMRKHR